MGLEAGHVLCEAKMALVRVVAIEYGECDVVHQDQQEHDRVLVEPAAFEGERNEPKIRQEQNGDLRAVAGQEGGVHEGAEEVARDDGGRLVQIGVDQHVVVLGPGEQNLGGDGQVVLLGSEEEGGVEFPVEGPHSAELVVVDEAVGGQAINNKQKECADCEDEVDLVLEDEVTETASCRKQAKESGAMLVSTMETRKVHQWVWLSTLSKMEARDWNLRETNQSTRHRIFKHTKRKKLRKNTFT